MRKMLIVLVLFITCLCYLQAQVWTNYINGVFTVGAPDIYCAVEDTSTNTLYIGGYFGIINQFTTHGVVSFNGSTFDTLQSGTDDDFPGPGYNSQVRKMVMYKNKLYVFGNFLRAGHNFSPYMAVWNGTSWDSIVSKGIPDFAFMDGDDMIITGVDSIQGVDVNGAARFDGSTWSDYPIPHTTGHTAEYIVKFQGKLYKSGQVTPSSSDANLSYSDGTNWIPWVGVLGNNNKAVFGMKVIDTLLFVYGRFYSIAGTQCAGLAAYNGKNWYGFGQGISTTDGWETVENIQKINGELYITGLFDKIEGIGNSNFPVLQSTNLAKFDGEKWCIISPPFNNTLLGITSYQNNLYAYGAFEKIGNDTVGGIGKYNSGFAEICSPNVIINMSTTGFNELISFEGLKIYPNPVKDKLTIEFNSFENSGVKIEIVNSLGQAVMSLSPFNQKQEMDLSFLPGGIYYLKLQNNSAQKVFKVVKE